MVEFPSPTRSLKTKSWFPSSVKNFTAHPRISLTVSADPFSPATVEIRARVLVFFPTPHRNAAEVMCDMSWVTSNSPQAPAALAWTTRSGIRSREKWARVSISCVSWRRARPPPPKPLRICKEAVGSPHGCPLKLKLVSVEYMVLQSDKNWWNTLCECVYRSIFRLGLRLSRWLGVGHC